MNMTLKICRRYTISFYPEPVMLYVHYHFVTKNWIEPADLTGWTAIRPSVRPLNLELVTFSV